MEKIIRVLDIDLDFFLEFRHRPSREKDRNNNCLKPWKPRDVEKFLEGSCGLSKTYKPRGKTFTHHHEVYEFCKNLREEDSSIFFDIDHVDAHADLGCMDHTMVSIFNDEKLIFGGDWIELEDERKYNLNPGNYLIFFILQGWLRRLNYINYSDMLEGDLNHYVLHKKDSQLFVGSYWYDPQNQNYDWEKIVEMRVSSRDGRMTPFNLSDYRCFNNCRSYDYIFLTQSPDYTPSASDELMEVITSYFEST